MFLVVHILIAPHDICPVSVQKYPNPVRSLMKNIISLMFERKTLSVESELYYGFWALAAREMFFCNCVIRTALWCHDASAAWAYLNILHCFNTRLVQEHHCCLWGLKTVEGWQRFNFFISWVPLTITGISITGWGNWNSSSDKQSWKHNA